MLALVPALYRKFVDRRRAERRECSLHAVVTLSNGQRVTAELIEFSRGGYRLVPHQRVAFPGGVALTIEVADYDRAQHMPLRLSLPARLLRRFDGFWAGDFKAPLDEYQFRRLLSAA